MSEKKASEKEYEDLLEANPDMIETTVAIDNKTILTLYRLPGDTDPSRFRAKRITKIKKNKNEKTELDFYVDE